MMEVVELINSRKYNMEVFTDAKGNKFIQIKKNQIVFILNNIIFSIQTACH